MIIFQGEEGGYLMILFNLSLYVLVCHKNALFQVILGLLGISIRPIL